MATNEPAPKYEYEQRGLDKLETIVTLMGRTNYDTDLKKAAYLFCSIIDGHPFSNGNKRLAVATLSYFLVANGYKISAPSMHALREALQQNFPHLQWEEVRSFQRSHEYFFYYLALVIADRNQKGHLTFTQEQEAVELLLRFITDVGDEQTVQM